MSKNEVKPISRKANIVVQEYEKEILIYDLTENKAFSLNESSALIWQICDGNNSVSEIADNLSKKFNSTIDENFVWLALEQLKKDNLLENSDEVITDFSGLSRRDIIRNVGLATIIALPMVSSLVAPMAVHAVSSSTPPMTACTQASDPGTPSVCPTTPPGQQNHARGCSCSFPGSFPAPQGNCSPGLVCVMNVPRTYAGSPQPSPSGFSACCTSPTTL